MEPMRHPEPSHTLPGRPAAAWACPPGSAALRQPRLSIIAFPCLLLGLLLSVPRPHAGATPIPQDANALVRKMVATYQAAKTFQENSEVKMTVIGSGEYYQTNSIKYKRPDLLALVSSDPKMGTVSAYANGSTVTVFTGKQNVYTKRTAPKNYAQTVALIEKTTAELGVPAAQVLNPVTFLLAKGLPREASAFRLAGGDNRIEGHSTQRVIGQATSALMQKLAPGPGLTPEKRDVILYLDAKTHLLIKCEMLLTWSAKTQIQGKGLQKIHAGYHYEETHHDAVLNAPIADGAFFFQPPKGATELFQEAR
jgi:outer membrane lipoprotein-sorting protein